ncbi:F-box associated domain containing protein [Tanacetum coccineum]
MSSFNPSIEDLPPNVTADVLSRLPVKTIIHCKCVCKNWRQLVSDSYFVNLHLSRSPAGIMIHHDSSPQKTVFLHMDDPGVIKWWEIEDDMRLYHDPVMNFDLGVLPKKIDVRGMRSVNVETTQSCSLLAESIPYGTFLNGTSIHWIVLNEDSPEKLYAFDIDNETFQLFPSPPEEKLVWVMKEYGIKRSWHKEVVIKQTNMAKVDWWMAQPLALLEGSKDGTILMLFSGVGLLVYCPWKKNI